MSNESLRLKAYEYIQCQILTGQLKADRPISEQTLAQQIGISRTPVREAIRQLVNEGLFEQVPRYGTLLRLPDRRELNELFEVRVALEGYVSAEVAKVITPEQLSELETLYQRMHDIWKVFESGDEKVLDAEQLQHFLAADSGFHMRMIQFLGNSQIMKIIGNYRVITRIFMIHRQDHDGSVVQQTLSDHLHILNALKEGDGEQAREVMIQHIRRSESQTLDTFDMRQQMASSDRTAGQTGLPPDVVEGLRMIGHPVEESRAGEA